MSPIPNPTNWKDVVTVAATSTKADAMFAWRVAAIANTSTIFDAVSVKRAAASPPPVPYTL